ncbi:RDD family protein [Dyella sp. A6]|uniref:RDD family protein n=1 Tax=Dyella aluminiiresistens TaxID=3069105 RepID=UPI002E78CA7F|nr:RDD family protein [Dyella sp. A6]
MNRHDMTPCPLWVRLIALLYDLLAVTALVMVVGLVCQLATHGRLIGDGPHGHVVWWYQPLQGTLVASYFLASWRRGGQTLGMRPWHTRVRALDGTPLRWRQALLRLLVAALPLAMLAAAPMLGIPATLWLILLAWTIWFTVALVDPRRRALHDLAAGTMVSRHD